MSSLPRNSAASSMVYGIIVGGHDSDPAPDQSGNMRVYFPGIHGKDVNIKHLAFSPRLMSPTRSSQQEFPGGLDPGTLVVALKDTGSNYCQILGLANDINNRDSRIPGKIDLLQFIAQTFTTEVDVRVPPNIKETTQGGARVRLAQEKGVRHNHDLYRGLPTHGALYPMSGVVLPQLRGIATATEAFNNIISGDLMSSLPGTPMSLGSMFDLLAGSAMKSLLKTLAPEVGAALNSMSYLVQSVESAEGAGFSTGSKVDVDTFMANAVDLFAQATNVSDIISCMSRLQTDTSLYGLDKLPPTRVSINTPFGQIYQSIDAFGNVATFSPRIVAQAASLFGKVFSGFPGVNIGQNLFGESSGVITNMMDSLPQDMQSSLKNMSEEIDSAEDLNEFMKKTAQGGNILV